MRLSAEYYVALDESKRHHASSKTFSGKFLRPHAPFIKEIIDRFGCTSILDYGCGKGVQYTWRNADPTGSIPVGMTIEEFWGVDVTKFDPAYPPFAAEPTGAFDLVICTHTLGSIPTADLPVIVDRLFGLAGKALYIAEKIGAVKKDVLSRPDRHPIGWGRNQWIAALTRAHTIDVTLCLREATDGGVTVERLKL